MCVRHYRNETRHTITASQHTTSVSSSWACSSRTLIVPGPSIVQEPLNSVQLQTTTHPTGPAALVVNVVAVQLLWISWRDALFVCASIYLEFSQTCEPKLS